MYETRAIELDLLAYNLVNKKGLTIFNRKQIVNLMNFKINAYEIEYFMERVHRNILLRNKTKYLSTPIETKNNKYLFQVRLGVYQV